MTITNIKFLSSKPHASRRTNTKSKLLTKLNNQFLIFFIGMLVGIIITLLIIILSKNNINLFSKSPNKKLTEQYKLIVPNTSKNKHNNYNPPKTINSSNNYEFYNLLPKMGTSTTNKNQYSIQAGIFHNLIEADELKAKLTLQGFEITIETSSTQDKNWYKVLLGPFSSEEIATTKKQQLDLAGFKNTFIRTNEIINEN